jgi:hypothetical protein
VLVPNVPPALEPGQRALSPDLPDAPVATIPAHALKPDDRAKTASTDAGAVGKVQVIRNEYVTDVKVRVIGRPGSDRVQVTGPLRPSDALIVASNVPLLAGTLIRFNQGAGVGGGAVEPTNPNPSESGATADVTPPRTAGRAVGGPAPIGAPGSAAPRGKNAPRTNPAAPPEATKGGNPVPF